jgi:DcaP outer membrane protein
MFGTLSRSRAAARHLTVRNAIPFLLAMLLPATGAAQGNDQAASNPRLELYGYVMTDAMYQWKQSDEAWFDVLRPTKLPAGEQQFGRDGRTWFSVRQTRFGAKSHLSTDLGELFAQFEWELFGVGVDAGQTTIRLRHAYAELGKFGAGQYWSPFMDIDIFPNSIEYWGPNGMVFFRNVQLRFMPIKGDSRVTFALERPGATGDQGRFEDRTELDNVRGRFPLPDFSAEGRLGGGWGYVELAGIIRPIKWDDLLPDDGFDLNGDDLGWGVSLSSNLKPSKSTVIRLQFVGGEGVQNYMNDAPVDVGIVRNPGNPTRPIEGKALGMLAATGFIDFQWSRLFSSSLGYSWLEVDNTEGQADDAFKTGQYALVNLLYYPTTNAMIGPEIQWGRRDNAFDNFHSDDLRIQLSARVNYSLKFWKELGADGN